MTPRKLIAIALIALVATAGLAVAAPPDHAAAGNAPADAPDDDHADDNATDDADDNADEGDENADEHAAAASNAQADRGPPADMPGPVPDHVGEIHDLIRGFLDGSVDNLGKEISAIVGGNGEDGGSAQAEG